MNTASAVPSERFNDVLEVTCEHYCTEVNRSVMLFVFTVARLSSRASTTPGGTYFSGEPPELVSGASGSVCPSPAPFGMSSGSVGDSLMLITLRRPARDGQGLTAPEDPLDRTDPADARGERMHARYLYRVAAQDDEMTTRADPETSPDDDLDDWYDSVAFLTPVGPSQWLPGPLAMLVVGIGAGIGLGMLFQTGQNRSSFWAWTYLVAGCLIALWAFPLAWRGWHAAQLVDLDTSKRFVRFRTASLAGVCIVVSFAGVLAGGVILFALSFGTLYAWKIRAARRTTGPPPSEFRRSLAVILHSSLLVEGLVLVFATLGTVLVSVVLFGADSKTTTYYFGSGVVSFLLGTLTIVWILQTDADGVRIKKTAGQ